MKRGLVIGKFLPVHQGHVALINFAIRQCDELIVSMSYTDEDQIAPLLRFSWIQQIFQHNTAIKTHMLRDDFDDESLLLVMRTKIWGDFIERTYPRIDLVFSSESYGVPFSQHLHAAHISFDPGRVNFPVSSTLIRQHPFKYWEFIPGQVRPYFIKKVCLYGPESTGKSTMAQRMAERYHTEFVPEVARELITSNNFTIEDIERIGRAHARRIAEKSSVANKILFCDTDVITTQIYSRHYLGVVPEILYFLETRTSYDQYFLFDIDVPWVADGLRDLGEYRENMMTLFREELVKRNITFKLIKGSYEEREELMINAIDDLIK